MTVSSSKLQNEQSEVFAKLKKLLIKVQIIV